MPERRGKLKLVHESEAIGRTREIFQELKQALGLPGVPILYEAYAAFPEFLELHWRAFRPLLASERFFVLADRLRGEAYTRTHNYFQIGDLCGPLTNVSFSSGAKHQLGDVIELFNYKDAPVLLIASTQLLAFDQAISVSELPGGAPVRHPQFHERPVLVEEDLAAAQVKRTYEEIKRILGLPVLNGDYKAFARWPDFLQEYWKALKPIVQSAAYREQERALCESSEAMAKGLEIPLDLSFEALAQNGFNQKQIEGIVRTTRIVQNVFSGLLLNIEVAKIGFEGGTAKPTADREFAA